MTEKATTATKEPTAVTAGPAAAGGDEDVKKQAKRQHDLEQQMVDAENARRRAAGEDIPEG